MSDAICKLLDKIDKLELKIKELEKHNFNILMEGMTTYKGISIEEMYKFYIERGKNE